MRLKMGARYADRGRINHMEPKFKAMDKVLNSGNYRWCKKCDWIFAAFFLLVFGAVMFYIGVRYAQGVVRDWPVVVENAKAIF